MTIEETIVALVGPVVREAVRAEVGRLLDERAPTAEGKGLISVKAAAQYADVHPATVRDWIKDGRLQAQNAGRHLKVLFADLERFLSGKKPDGGESRAEDIADAILARKRKA